MRGIRLRILLLAAFVLSIARSASADDGIAAIDTSRFAPAYLLEMPDSVSDILIADAESASLRRFTRTGNGVVEKDRRYMSIGLNGTGKRRAWDRKTPLGIYFITESIDTSRLHEKYGVAAYALDYPNAWDRHRDRTGSGIWLHGVDRRNPERPPRDTDGCLALPNEEISQLKEVLEPHITPVIVARTISWVSEDELQKTRQEFRRALETWTASLAGGDHETFLSLYAEDFTFGYMDRDEWASSRLLIFESGLIDSVVIDDVMLLADPEEPDLFLSRFTQFLLTGTGPEITTKRLYWRRKADARWEIVAEESG